ncbi:hypothetical protein DL96DRAFT_1813006 [Flagelloscypha sp. PMI_526]|nr:hypothetical protein DL96DRAFT_1813006 [Flagelloscypha sp. PMI_526]
MTALVLKQRQGRIPVEIQDDIFSLVAVTSPGDLPAIARGNKHFNNRVTPLLYTNVHIRNLPTLRLFLSLPRPLVQALQIKDCRAPPCVPKRMWQELAYQEYLVRQIPEMCPNVQKLALRSVPLEDKGLLFRLKHLTCLIICDPDSFAQYFSNPDSEGYPATDSNEDKEQSKIYHKVKASRERMKSTKLLAQELIFRFLTHVYFGDIAPWNGKEFLIPLSCFPALTHLAFLVDPYSDETPPSLIANIVEEWITKVPNLRRLVLRFEEDWESEQPLRIWHQHVRSLLPSHPARADNRIVCNRVSEDDRIRRDQFKFMNRLWAYAENPRSSIADA